MSAGWEIGDLALCVVGGHIACPTSNGHYGGKNPPLGAISKVIAISPAMVGMGGVPARQCGCLSLHFPDGSLGHVGRFRKIRPDEHEACEPEFVTLIKRAKRPATVSILDLPVTRNADGSAECGA